jgi:glycine cleavage system regulatory protein
MQRSLVMTVIGTDKPGLVESIASAVARQGGNWLESRMSRLGGQFAGILRIEFPAEKEPAMIEALKGLEPRGLSVVIHTEPRVKEAAAQTASHLEIVGHDRPGIVREISKVLASHKVNVEELSSELSSAAMSGEMLFKAKASLSLPKTCDAAVLQADLEKIAGDLIVDMTFHA